MPLLLANPKERYSRAEAANIVLGMDSLWDCFRNFLHAPYYLVKSQGNALIVFKILNSFQGHSGIKLCG